MNSYRKTAIVVGILFIIATVAPLLSGPFINVSAENLAGISANSSRVTAGALLELIMALAIAGIAITIYPILRKNNKTLAIGYVGIRIIEGVVFLVVAVIGLLSLISLSEEYVKAGSTVASNFQTVGTLLLSAHDWAYVIGGQVVFSVSALILNYVLFQSRLVPRFISVWGLIGAVLILAGGISGMFDLFAEAAVLETVIFLPIAVQEMVFAVWLIVKGFSQSALDYVPASIHS